MSVVTPLFLLALLASLALELWLSFRQQRHVSAARRSVPVAFAATVSAAEHARAADYTLARLRAGRLELTLDAVLTLGLTLGGGLAWLDEVWRTLLAGPLLRGVGVIASVGVLNYLLHLPLTLHQVFGIEARFGFNRMTGRLFVTDALKGLLLAVLLGGPLLLLVLALMERAGPLWWLAAWAAWASFALLMTWAYPTLIAPLFNRFHPLDDPALSGRIGALLERCGFACDGVFVTDGSRRSTHANAYFTGIGRHKRIVFFDTLLGKLSPAQIESVLAHELGHFRLHHVRTRLIVTLAGALVALAVLGALAGWDGFYRGLGVPQPSSYAALLLFGCVVPVFAVFTRPLAALWSRRHEYAADEFAARHASAAELAAALVRLHRDNATTLTPDPLYVRFYYSHPPALERIARLDAAAQRGDCAGAGAPAGAAIEAAGAASAML